MEMVKLSGLTNMTKVRLGKQTNYVFEFVRQGKMVCDKQNQIWIDSYQSRRLEILTKGVETRSSVTYLMKVVVVGEAVVVSLDPPCEGKVVISGVTKEVTKEHPAVIYMLPRGASYRASFIPADTSIDAVESKFTIV